MLQLRSIGQKYLQVARGGDKSKRIIKYICTKLSIMDKMVLHQTTVNELVDLISDAVVSRITGKVYGDDSSDDCYLTRQEACRMMRIGLVTLRARTKAGIIPSYKIGARVLYKKNDIDTYINLNNLKV